MKNIFLFFITGLLLTPLVQAQEELDPVAEAQAFLKNEQRREELFKKDEKAKEADTFAGQAVGGDKASKEELYSISADIMAQLVKEGKQDPAKMQEILKKALVNPEAFTKSLSPEIQARIKAVADKTESQRAFNGSKDKSLKSP